MAPDLPASYNTLSLPDIQLSHHPASSAAVTPVIIIKLHRPAGRNSFTDRLCSSLISAYDLLSRDARVRCIVLTSSDPRNRFFCAGMELRGSVDASSSFGPTAAAHRDGGGQLTLAIQRCNKPTVAAINGSAVGVGITMTLPAAVRIASRDAKVGFVFGRRGFNLEACSSFYLPRLIGTSRALHLVTTGAVYPATHRLLGELFSEVVAPDEVLPRALAVADDIAANMSGVAARVMRDMIYRGPNSPEEAHLLESRVFYDLATGRDSKEGIQSFLEKRAPDFKATMEEDAPGVYPWWKPVDVRHPSKL